MRIYSLSPSKVAMAMRCPMQLWHLLTVGPRPPGFTMVFGSSYHAGVEVDLQKKIEGENCEVDEMITAFEAEFQDRLCEAERKDGELAASEYFNIGVASIKRHKEAISPQFDPVAVEVPLEVDIDGFKMRCRIDLIARGMGIVDHKTAWRKWATGREHKEVQPLAYALPFWRKEKKLLDFTFSVFYPNIVERKRDCFEFRKTSPNAKSIEAFAQIVRNVGMMMVEERPVPNTSGWWCSEKWCGWWDVCEFGRGRVVV